MEARGHGGQLRFENDTLTISHKGVLGLLTQGLKGNKEIRVDLISSIQFKDAGLLTNGYIQFAFVGGQETKQGLFDAVSDENTVLFTKTQQPQFEAIRDAIKARIKAYQNQGATPAQSSVADEIIKFAKLRDDGLITDDEFQAKKKQLLGL